MCDTLVEIFAGSDMASDFVLSGGTALAAFYLEHRLSDDLDFFSHLPGHFPPTDSLRHWMERHLGQAIYNRIADRRQFSVSCEGVLLKVEFVPLYFSRLGSPVPVDGIYVDSLEDIAANKIIAMADRFDPKDFFDVWMIAKKTPLDIGSMVKLAERKHKANYRYLLHLERIIANPASLEAIRAVEVFDPHEVTSFFRTAVKKLALEAIPKIYLNR
ncbi:nucleotidyl transferase AbiEii/AbiGii toxin family protein [Desulfosoma sp.]